MKKTLLAICVAATAFAALPAMAAGNTAQVVIHGVVFDDSESCNVTPKGAIGNSIVLLDDIKVATMNTLAVNTPSLAHAKDIVYEVKDCKTGGKDYTGNLDVSLKGEYITGMTDVLVNQITTDAAENASITLINNDNSRISFDGSNSQTIAYTPGSTTFVRYKATYVKTAASAVTTGSVKGTAVMTISY
ncbi:MAG: fimbrial protein [Leclercia sp.]